MSPSIMRAWRRSIAGALVALLGVACAPHAGAPVTDGIARGPTAAPSGHRAQIACHNCYESSGPRALDDTLAKIHRAQADGADVIELDLCEEGGVVRVQHDDDATLRGATLEEVLADPGLRAGDQLLFIELKETRPTDAFMASVLDALVANGYGGPGRPVVLRAFEGVVENLDLARKLLRLPRYAALRPNVRFHLLVHRADGDDPAKLRARMQRARGEGMQGVELEQTTEGLLELLAYARRLGLTVGVWTVPIAGGGELVARLRDRVDVLMCDYPIASACAIVSGVRPGGVSAR